MNYVFVSYSRRDHQFVDRLTDDLQKAGIEVWRDIEQIGAGKNWAKEIDEGLKSAKALIFVSSRNSIYSEYIKYEIYSFYNKNKIIIPLVLDDVGANEMPLFLKSFQWVDFRQNYENAIKKIILSLSKNIEVGEPIAPKKKLSKGYVFISYTEEDSDFVIDLKGFLKKNGFAYWDYEESDRDYHSQLFLELESVISEALATISVLSESWKRSQWTVKEYFFSVEIGTPVFLLKAKEIGPTLAIAGIPYIDFFRDKELGFQKLKRELERKGL